MHLDMIRVGVIVAGIAAGVLLWKLYAIMRRK